MQLTAATRREIEKAIDAWNALTEPQRAAVLKAANTACPATAMRHFGHQIPANIKGGN